MLWFLPTTNPHRNLAIEEFLLKRVNDLGPTLLLYVNSECVVMGKHQNPWLECRPEFLQGQNIPLLRRITGGGTVFHDCGNLNFSFLMPRNHYNEQQHFLVVQNALVSMGITSTVDEHKSMWHENRKFSGSAFARKLVGNIHHGTLLIDSNLERLHEAILPSITDSKTRAPRSRRATVMNLREANAQLNVAGVAEALQEHFALEFPRDACTPPPLEFETELAELEAKHHSWNWVFGSTPDY